MHRALSWLNRAEQLARSGDTDGQFIVLWIAFNAAYATEIDERYRESEQLTFRGFLEKLTELGLPGWIYGLNPMAGVVEGFRWALLGSDTAPGPILLVSTAAALALLVSGAFYFRRMERTFADIV